jgi:hypothetical protein
MLLPCFAGIALAEELSDIKIRGLLQFEGFEHWLNASYDFSDSKTSKSSNVSQAFQESYNAALQFALFDPRILDSSLQGSVAFNQNQGSDNATYQYNYSGSGLNKSPIPLTLLSFRSINTVQNTFSSPTTSDNVGNEFGISFLNDKLRSRFQFTRNSSDTSGGGTSGTSLSNAYSYSAEHKYGDFCSTSLSASFSDQSGGSSSGDKLTSSANSLALGNSLSFGAARNYTLSSSFQLNNTVADNLPQRSISISEAFSAPLGQALSFNASYSLANSRSSDPVGLLQENTQNQGTIGLSHKLFESLTTQLNGTASFNRQNDGAEKQFSVTGNASYNKKLSEGSSVSLGVSKAYNLVDRQVASSTTTVRDELHARAHQGDVIQLALSDGTLRSVSAVTGRSPIFTYVEGVDYTVNYPLGRITILSGGGVRIDADGTGTDLYLSYTVYKDPQITYSSDSFSVTSDLSLFNSQINIGASWSTSGQTLIKGPATNSLQGSQSMMLYAGGYYDRFTGRLSYQKQISGSLTSQSYGGEVTTNWQTDKSTISLSARDSFATYDATSTAAASWDNNADMSVSYQRNILANTTLSLQGNVNDSRSKLNSSKDSFSLRANSQVQLNKVSISLSGQTSWVLDKSGTSRNDSFHIDLSRYF